MESPISTYSVRARMATAGLLVERRPLGGGRSWAHPADEDRVLARPRHMAARWNHPSQRILSGRGWPLLDFWWNGDHWEEADHGLIRQMKIASSPAPVTWQQDGITHLNVFCQGEDGHCWTSGGTATTGRRPIMGSSGR